MLSNIYYCGRTVHFSRPYKEIRVCSGGVWPKSSISQQIVPRNRNSKSMEGKQFINVRLGTDIVIAPIFWSQLMHLCLPLAFVCHFQAERFHTLKIESDFYSRQGHWPLCWTGVYQSILLNEKKRRSSFYFLTKTKKLTANSISKKNRSSSI